MLKICNKYGTVPVVEIKDSKMSDEAVRKLIDDLYSSKLLDVSWVISFHDGPLKQAITTAKQRYGVTLQTMRLITKDEDQSILSQVKKARKKGYTGVNLSQSYATEKAVDWAQDKGMRVGIWTYSKKKLSDLYEMIVENDPDFMTINGKLFDD